MLHTLLPASKAEILDKLPVVWGDTLSSQSTLLQYE